MKPVLLLTGCASYRALVALCLVLWEVVEVGRSAAILFSGVACSCETSSSLAGVGGTGMCRCGVNGSTRPCHGCRAGSSPVICSEFMEMCSNSVTSYLGYVLHRITSFLSVPLSLILPRSCGGVIPGDAIGF